ncbi:MAG: helix-turn-helix domain-containing protein [Oligoflexia bacterium]|nr:helix-turn-helix domain-containing protein [Oligoflexia bacterium]
MSNAENKIMNMEELAELLRITETTAYQLVRSGEIPGRKVGREWRFLREQVLEWLQHNDKKGKGQEMDNVVYRDEWGGEYTVINGEEKIALWLPMSRKDKELLTSKAVSKNVKVSELVANFLKNWIREN